MSAQEAENKESSELKPEVRQVSVLQSLAVLIEKTETELEKIEALREKASTAAEQLQLTEQIQLQNVELSRLKLEFLSFAVCIEEEELGPIIDEPLSLNAEVRELLNPILSELKEATSGPRRLEALQRRRNLLLDEQKTASKVLQGLEDRLAGSPEAMVEDRLLEIQKSWKEKLENLKAKLDVTEYKIEELQNVDESIIQKSTRGLQSFFKTRGRNLLIATLGAILTFLLVRKGYAYFRSSKLFRHKKEATLYRRALDLMIHIFSSVMALLVFVLVLYLANDWVMLVVALLFIGGVAWAGKQALPQFMEQGKLMLNFGPVREGERIVYEGIPWKVGRIRIYTKFTNSALKGGLIRLPIRQLMEMHSRPHDGELWFPCLKDDWVLLENDLVGKIVEQTPEHVQLIRLGGLRKIIPTASFLEANPSNLSKGFRVTSIFGIDYAHQKISTTEVPGIFEEAIERELISLLDQKLVKNVSVQFSSAGASSLDYEVQADFHGDAASKYRFLHRTIQRICVDVCNEQGWGIPFAQITVHRADDSSVGME
ncbi:hypothetical protein N9A94_04045 [Akkermansiaceae bacterium]|nr:hypothetical protein [Akkermansiaceae bacterium]